MEDKYFKIGKEFADLAEQYIDAVDNKLHLSLIEFFIIIHRSLSKLYAAGAALPIVEGMDVELNFDESLEESLKKLAPRTEIFFKRKKRLKKIIGKKDRYWHIFDPIDEKEKDDSCEYCISGDLAEIYDNIMDGLNLWRLDDPLQQEEAISTWQIHYECHWGYHTLNALRALHRHIEEFFIDYDGDDFDEIQNKYL